MHLVYFLAGLAGSGFWSRTITGTALLQSSSSNSKLARHLLNIANAHQLTKTIALQYSKAVMLEKKIQLCFCFWVPCEETGSTPTDLKQNVQQCNQNTDPV
jgi:hypothetical protein